MDAYFIGIVFEKVLNELTGSLTLSEKSSLKQKEILLIKNNKKYVFQNPISKQRLSK